MHTQLRCYAEREKDGSWFAICIDLNLYARGNDFEEARTKLNRLVYCYIDEALGKDKAYVRDLIPRPAPLSFKLKYEWIRLMHKIFHSQWKLNFELQPPRACAA